MVFVIIIAFLTHNWCGLLNVNKVRLEELILSKECLLFRLLCIFCCTVEDFVVGIMGFCSICVCVLAVIVWGSFFLIRAWWWVLVHELMKVIEGIKFGQHTVAFFILCNSVLPLLLAMDTTPHDIMVHNWPEHLLL